MFSPLSCPTHCNKTSRYGSVRRKTALDLAPNAHTRTDFRVAVSSVQSQVPFVESCSARHQAPGSPDEYSISQCSQKKVHMSAEYLLAVKTRYLKLFPIRQRFVEWAPAFFLLLYWITDQVQVYDALQQDWDAFLSNTNSAVGHYHQA